MKLKQNSTGLDQYYLLSFKYFNYLNKKISWKKDQTGLACL